MSELALKLIHENINKHQCGENARSLDLGNCGLSEVPEEIGQCIWIEKLSFADYSWDWKDKELIGKRSQNDGEQNIISHLPHSITKLKNLNQLAVCGSITNRSPLADISFIAELINLKSFTCWNTGLSDFSPLTKLTKLKILLLGITNLSDLTPFAELTSLQALTCFFSQVADLSPLIRLNNLQYLDCSYTQVSDLSPLSELYNLQNLHCSSTQVSDLSPLTELTQLQNLYSSHTKISDLTPLTDLTNLQCLNCSYTLISDLFTAFTKNKEWNSCYLARSRCFLRNIG